MAKQNRKVIGTKSRKVKKQPPINFERKRLKRKTFSYLGHVHIHGDVKIEEELVVGGNLIIDGNLDAGTIYCVGRIKVGGNVSGGTCYVGISIHSDGYIVLAHLKTGLDTQHIADLIGLEDDDTDDTDLSAIDKLVDSEILQGIDLEREFWSNPAVKAGKFLDCYGLEAHGDVEVTDWFDCDTSEIAGSLYAANIYLEGDLWVSGLVHSQRHLTCDSVFASEIICNGNLECDSIQVDGSDLTVLGSILTSGSIHVAKNIQAGKWIAVGGGIRCGAYVKAGEFVVSDKEISTGNDYGICAALCLPRPQWSDQGYVSAPKKPHNILTGKFVEGKTFEIATDEFAEREILSKILDQG